MAKLHDGPDYTFEVIDGRKQADPNWTGRLLIGKGDKIKPVLANAALALRCSPEWFGALAYDEFRLEIMLEKATPWETVAAFKTRPWAEYDRLRATEWLNHQGIDVPEGVTHQAATVVAKENGYHPVKHFLTGLRWDEKPRVDSWLTDYLGVEPNAYVSAVGRRFAAHVLRWEIEEDGKPVPFNTANLLRLLRVHWVAEQVDSFAADRAAHRGQ